MAALPQGLNGDEAPENEFEPIDAGAYNAEIIGSNGKSKDSGAYTVGLQFKVIDGPKDGRTFWLNFNFLNPKSAINQEIAQKQLKQIAKAIGVSTFENTEDLHGRAMNITVKKKTGDYEGNEMSSVRPYQNAGAKPPARQPASGGAKQGAPAGANGGGGNRPWGGRS